MVHVNLKESVQNLTQMENVRLVCLTISWLQMDVVPKTIVLFVLKMRYVFNVLNYIIPKTANVTQKKPVVIAVNYHY